MTAKRERSAAKPSAHREVSLTRNQRKVYQWLAAHPERSYTIAQIARFVGLSPGTTEKHLETLLAEDLIHEPKTNDPSIGETP